ncbi:hypothetical protein, partial [Propionivibrio sp.]|uniref:hypothetical protein n=1 Tax=Propionivibrio sp. TaxID=2212460 RepID=UPI00344CAA3A
LYQSLGNSPETRSAAYRELFRPQLDAEAAETIREALRLGMPLGSERFAESICRQLGIRRNTGQRGRPVTEKEAVTNPLPGQTDFGF